MRFDPPAHPDGLAERLWHTALAAHRERMAVLKVLSANAVMVELGHVTGILRRGTLTSARSGSGRIHFVLRNWHLVGPRGGIKPQAGRMRFSVPETASFTRDKGRVHISNPSPRGYRLISISTVPG